MKIFALSDLHLSFSCPEKSMNAFGGSWTDHHIAVKNHWNTTVSPDDYVCIAGDITWASSLQKANLDLQWIDTQLNGHKIISKGNHDYWWSSKKKLKELQLLSITFVDKEYVSLSDSVHICAMRYSEDIAISYNDYIEWSGSGFSKRSQKEESELLLQHEKEIQRLSRLLTLGNKLVGTKICMLHYPPIGPEGVKTQASELLSLYGINHCIFGHIHALKSGLVSFPGTTPLQYHLTSCDYLNNTPTRII